MTLAARARGLVATGALISGLLIGACGGSAPGTGPSDSTTGTATTVPGPEGLPEQTGTQLAPLSGTVTGADIDGIQCASLEQLAHEAEVHLTVYDHGRLRALPAGIGMVSPQTTGPGTGTGTIASAGQCYYWLHTDADDGIIQVDSPNSRTFTLGEFFDVWGQPLSRGAVAGLRGHVIAIVDGRRWPGSPRRIALTPYTTIELAVGRPVPRFRRTDWAALTPQPVGSS